ncbi:MAG: hypothetical protein KGI10_01920 [Thaumarchaeota archaeon]|nr:hypothetical protein [Nitrososphaerota archaeon]
MHLLDNYSQSFIVTNQQRVDAQREQFKISSVSIANNNKFNITVQNTGQIPINITRIWIQDTTISTSPAKYNVGQSVAPNGILKNIGQGSAFPTASSQDTYSMQLVTSRGNTQQFSVNSVGTAPLNIQFYAFPSTIASDFTTELVMVVTNNQTGTLANLVPTVTKTASTAACNLSATPIPPSVSTLAPGSTAVFKWDLKVTGSDGKFCTYSASLTNGFPGNMASTTATINAITATSSNWSTTWGIISINYTSLKWAQNGGTNWNTNWAIPCGSGCGNTDVWRMDVTNNDPTRSFVINGNTTLVLFGSSPGSNAATQFYVIKNDYAPMHGYLINGQTIGPNSTGTLYFGSKNVGTADPQSISKTGQYAVSILIFGYWNTVQSNNFFGQNIPYEGIIVS